MGNQWEPPNSPLIYLPQNQLLLGVGHNVHPAHGATGSSWKTSSVGWSMVLITPRFWGWSWDGPFTPGLIWGNTALSFLSSPQYLNWMPSKSIFCFWLDTSSKRASTTLLRIGNTVGFPEAKLIIKAKVCCCYSSVVYFSGKTNNANRNASVLF